MKKKMAQSPIEKFIALSDAQKRAEVEKALKSFGTGRAAGKTIVQG